MLYHSCSLCMYTYNIQYFICIIYIVPVTYFPALLGRKLHILLPFKIYFSVHFLRIRIFSNMITAQLSTAVNLTLILYFHLIYGPHFHFVIWPNNVLFSTSWPSPGSSLGPGIAFSCDVTIAVLHFLWSWHFSKTQFPTLKNRVFLNRCLSDISSKFNSSWSSA